MRPDDLWLEVLRAAPAKLLGGALGRHKATIYRWAEGENGLLDWFETLVQLLAVRPNGRPILIKLQYWTDQLFRRALHNSQQSPISTAQLRAKSCKLLRETADVIEACGRDVDQIDRSELVKDALEVRDLVERIIAAAEVGFRDDDEGGARLRATR